jgi:hypothetical protein
VKSRNENLKVIHGLHAIGVGHAFIIPNLLSPFFLVPRRLGNKFFCPLFQYFSSNATEKQEIIHRSSSLAMVGADMNLDSNHIQNPRCISLLAQGIGTLPRELCLLVQHLAVSASQQRLTHHWLPVTGYRFQFGGRRYLRPFQRIICFSCCRFRNSESRSQSAVRVERKTY